MALGCPTIGANAGGIAEILDDGVNGLLHRAGDPSDIAAKIMDLLKNPGQAAELGRQAAADCERRYYPEVVAGQIVEFYRRVISRHAHTSAISMSNALTSVAAEGAQKESPGVRREG